MDLITACDVRLCSRDAFFCVKEVDIGLAADIGTLQRLPRVVGSASLVREWCLSARRVDADEALRAGLVSRVLVDRDALMAEAVQLAKLIASKSPVAVVGTKALLLHSRDTPSVDAGLRFNAVWSGAMLQTDDIAAAVAAGMSRPPALAQFSRL